MQTDGGTEFTKRFTKGSEHDETRSWKQLREYGIEHQKIRPYTPRHNGKVERSHRKDNEEFHASHKFDSFADFKRQLARHNRICNAFPMRPLGWDSPNECLKKHLAQCNTGLTDLQAIRETTAKKQPSHTDGLLPLRKFPSMAAEKCDVFLDRLLDKIDLMERQH